MKWMDILHKLTVTLFIVTFRIHGRVELFKVFPKKEEQKCHQVVAWTNEFLLFIILLAPTLPLKHSCKWSVMLVYGVKCLCCV